MAQTKAMTTTKKAVRTTKPKTSVISAKPIISKTTSGDQPRMKIPAIKLKKSYIIIGLGVIALGILIYLVRGFVVVATVNGQPITRLEVVRQLEKQNGKQVLDGMIVKALVLQEANKKRVTVSDKDISDEVKRVEDLLVKSGQKLDQALAMRGLSQAEWKEQIKLQKLAEKIVGDTAVSDKEVADYIAQNKEALGTDTPEDQLKKDVQEQLKSQKLSEKIQTWLESLKTSAKINYLIKY